MGTARILGGFLLFGAAWLFLQGCQASAAKEAEIKVDDLVCELCAKTVGEALRKTEGVHKVEVDTEAKLVRVRYEEGKVDVKALERAVAKAGYKANETPAEPEAYKRLPDCCKING